MIFFKKFLFFPLILTINPAVKKEEIAYISQAVENVNFILKEDVLFLCEDNREEKIKIIEYGWGGEIDFLVSGISWLHEFYKTNDPTRYKVKDPNHLSGLALPNGYKDFKGRHIAINLRKWQGWSDETRVNLLAHEMLHLFAFQHIDKVPNLMHSNTRLTTDFVYPVQVNLWRKILNAFLEDEGFKEEFRKRQFLFKLIVESECEIREISLRDGFQ